MRNKQSIFLASIVSLMGVGMLVLGYLIEFQKKITLIAGYQSGQAKNPGGLAHFIGYGLLALGAFELIMAILLIALPSRLKTLLITLAIIDFVGIFVLVIGMRSYL